MSEYFFPPDKYVSFDGVRYIGRLVLYTTLPEEAMLYTIDKWLPDSQSTNKLNAGLHNKLMRKSINQIIDSIWDFQTALGDTIKEKYASRYNFRGGTGVSFYDEDDYTLLFT